MFAIKKFAQHKPALLCFAAAFLLLVSCGNHVFNEPNYSQASVEFCNESSYSIIIHQSYFDGPVLAKLIPAQCISKKISPSNNYGVGTVFSVEYWHLIENEVWIGGEDPDRQIKQNLEAGESYLILIPQPKSLDLQESFIKIENVSDMDLELKCLDFTFYQVNRVLSVPSSKSGLYSGNNIKSSSCFSNGESKGLAVKQGLQTQYPFPEFTIVNGYIHNFEFDGNEVIQKDNEKIIKQ